MNDCYYICRDRDGYRLDTGGGGFDWLRLLLSLAIAMVMLVVLQTLTSCKTKYVSVPEYHKEYIVRSDTIAKVDSVVIKDSVFVYHSGDTVVMNKVLYRDRVRNVWKTRTDTLMRSDSVRVPYPVERELTRQEKRYLTIGNYTCQALQWVLAAAVIAFLAWMAGKVRNK